MRDLSENTPVIPYGDSSVACNYSILPYMMRFFQPVEGQKSGVSEVLRVTWPMIIANWTSKLRQTSSDLFNFIHICVFLLFTCNMFFLIQLYSYNIVCTHNRYIYLKNKCMSLDVQPAQSTSMNDHFETCWGASNGCLDHQFPAKWVPLSPPESE